MIHEFNFLLFRFLGKSVTNCIDGLSWVNGNFWLPVQIASDPPSLAYRSKPRMGTTSVQIRFQQRTPAVDPYLLIACGLFRSSISVNAARNVQMSYMLGATA